MENEFNFLTVHIRIAILLVEALGHFPAKARCTAAETSFIAFPQKGGGRPYLPSQAQYCLSHNLLDHIVACRRWYYHAAIGKGRE
eukprot:COSAG06_NODE_5350_length_3532_cov_40.227789_5_plen_85_part_00